VWLRYRIRSGKPIFYSWSPVEVLKPAEIRHF